MGGHQRKQDPQSFWSDKHGKPLKCTWDFSKTRLRKLENHLTIWLVELAHQSAVVSDLQVDLLTVMEKRVRSFKKRFIHPTRHYHTKAMWVCLHTLLDTKMKLGGFSQILSLSLSHYVLDSVQWPSPTQGKHIFTVVIEECRVSLWIFPPHSFISLRLSPFSLRLSLTFSRVLILYFFPQ